LAVLGCLALLWGLACGYLYKNQDALIYPNAGPAYDTCGLLNLMGGVAQSRTWNGQELRYVLFKGAHAKATLLFFHGNGGTVCGRALHVQHLSSPDWDLVMLEYPGYGGDVLPPSQERILANALAAFDLFHADAPRRPILAFGESLGTGPATYLAARRPVAALVLQTPYPSINAIAAGRYKVIPVSLLNRSPFPAEDWAPQVACPVLILHGTSDEIIPYELARRQARNFRHLLDFETFVGAHHTDMPYREPTRFWGDIVRFLEQYSVAPN
jgi:pimeloyl-ACP methyl ester carboxylesterase